MEDLDQELYSEFTVQTHLLSVLFSLKIRMLSYSVLVLLFYRIRDYLKVLVPGYVEEAGVLNWRQAWPDKREDKNISSKALSFRIPVWPAVFPFSNGLTAQ